MNLVMDEFISQELYLFCIFVFVSGTGRQSKSV